MEPSHSTPDPGDQKAVTGPWCQAVVGKAHRTQRLTGMNLLPKGPSDEGGSHSGTLCLTFAVGTGCPQGAWPALTEPLPWGVPWTE